MEWRRGQTIGRGSSATVSIAICCRSSYIFAVKSVELSQSESLQREQRLLCTLSSPRIVSYEGCDITSENNKLMYNLKLEYVAAGTLIDAIRNKGGGLDEPTIGCYTHQILQGLEYLHSSGIAHCDIKGGNILISETGAKLADLGCAKWVNSVATTIGGTPMFMAPEVARGEEQGFPADIWALGCTIIEMATGSSPWPNISDPMTILYQIAYSGKSPDIPEYLSQQAVDFLSKCFKRDPNERWTVKQLLKHPFLEKFSSSRKQNQELNTTSPTSILDYRIWNSVQEESESQDDVLCLNSCTTDQRIGRLPLNSRVPTWRWEEAWITIRENNDEEEDKRVCG